jgi:hypothetical protein
VIVTYVEPNYAAGDFLPELFSDAKPAAIVREAIALQTMPVNFTIFLGMLNVGGTFGQGFGGKNGIFSYFIAYESS